MTMCICQENPFDHASLSNKETRDVEKELDEIVEDDKTGEIEQCGRLNN